MFNRIFSYFKPKKSNLLVKKTFNFLVVSALQEELNAFTTISNKLTKIKKYESGAVEYIYKKSKTENIKILTYSANKMGMAYNGAAIMKIIMLHQPVYTFFIGTCAGIKDANQKMGDVLVPQFVYNYESGKYKYDGSFESDHICFETDEEIRKCAEIIKFKVTKNFNVFTDENFCSGSSVIDNSEKRTQIAALIPRKVTGLDMESFSIACINDILKPEGKRISVVKGIMDFANNKELSEKMDNKNIAKKNSARFTLMLIEYIHSNVFLQDEVYIKN